MTLTATTGSLQGVSALKNGSQIGGATIFTGAGAPATVLPYANRIGDLYVDYTNGILYIAGATGTGSWTAGTGSGNLASGVTIGGTTIFTLSGSPAGVKTAARIGDIAIDYTNGILYTANATGTGGWISPTLNSGVLIGGTSYFTGSGTPKSVVTPIRIGDGYTDYTNANEWIATGTTNTSWVLVAQGIGAGSGIVQTYIGTITQAQAQAGVILVPAQAGHTLKVIYMKLIVPATVGGSGNLVFTDTSVTITIATATEAALATASGATTVLSSEYSTAVTGWTYGTGLLGTALTAANGIRTTASGSLTLTNPITVVIEYMVS